MGTAAEGGQARAPVRRAVRSYVLRSGRLTAAQERALTGLWPRFGIEDAPEPVDWQQLFGNRNPVIVEVGFGDGDATWQMARARPEHNFVGVEVHRPGIGHLLLKLGEHGIGNVRVACADAVEFFERRVADRSLHGVRLFFPDPWPKKRHHKRRIVQPAFVGSLVRALRPAGILHLATDWEPYATHMLEVLHASPGLRNLSASGEFCARPEWRPQTRYELRGQRLGHRVYDLVFSRAG